MTRKLTDAVVRTWVNLRRAGLSNEEIEKALKPLAQVLSETGEFTREEVGLRQTA